MTFSDIGLDKNIQKAIADLGFEEPTPIQSESIPFLLSEENDLIALAQTGTGKTAAFGLPIIQQIEIENKQTQAIILCPTRELCLQITKDMETYSKYTKGLKITAVYGGTNIQTQIRALNSGSQIVVGTPGRVIDLIKRKKLKLANIEYVVLDEADEMLNMGFKEDLDTILAETPEEKRTLLFSATMPKEVMRITKNYMFSPKTIEVAGRNEGAKNVEHHYYMVNARDRYKALRRICDVNPEIYGIVFCRTRRETKDVADKLMQDGYNADALHGDLSQSQRDHVMGRFRKRNLQMLVATDVAARGIDIDDLTHIINYNLPDDLEVYVHRSGRTGRAGKNGISIIISHSRERRKLQAISKMLKKELILKQVPDGEEICAIQLLTLIDKVVKTDVNDQIEKYIPIIEEKLAHLDKEELLKHFVSAEFNRFLSFYKNAPDLNISANSKSDRGRKNDRGKNERREKKGGSTGHAEEGYTRFFINLGKLQNLETHNLIGLINEYTRQRNIPIGKIDILRKFSFFEVDSNHEQDVLAGLANANWNGNRVSVEVSSPPTPGGNDFRRKSSGNGRKRFEAKRKSSSSNKRKSSPRRGGGEGSFKDKFKASTRRKRS
jgi:ATP-dependent RNA helicase DeaD|tara:strand:- start:1638 stop:3461 length:1824 start_codon:yes stop_codon:yes gene_type:complete